MSTTPRQGTVNLYLRVPPALHAALLKAAHAKGTNATQLCIEVLSKAVKGQSK